jgi:alanyl-tRNA synthetase
MTTKAYLKDPALSGTMMITAVLNEDRPVIRAESTWFHAQGGGQKADRGMIGGVEVYNVRHAEGGEVDHYVTSLDGIAVGQSYEFLIDPDWRRMNANHHSAGHLIAAVTEAGFPDVTATNGHHWPGEARVEFKGAGVARVAAELADLQEQVDQAVRRASPIHVIGDPFTDRKVQIAGFPALPCGGTHASMTSELGSVVLRSAKMKGDTLRIGYDVFSTP